MLNTFKHLLPTGRAWSLTIEKKLRLFFEGLGNWTQSIREFFDAIYLDLWSQSTRQLSEYEDQHGLINPIADEQQRRDRLAASKKALGGQSPEYIQQTLQNHGFDAYVHEWWKPEDRPQHGETQCVSPRDPRVYLSDSVTPAPYLFRYGDGKTLGSTGARYGRRAAQPGYPLVNDLLRTRFNYLHTYGSAGFTLGSGPTLGAFSGITNAPLQYTLPSEVEKHAYFMYVCGATFGDPANISEERRAEFERLLLKICPLHLWIGVIVNFVSESLGNLNASTDQFWRSNPQYTNGFVWSGVDWQHGGNSSAGLIPRSDGVPGSWALGFRATTLIVVANSGPDSEGAGEILSNVILQFRNTNGDGIGSGIYSFNAFDEDHTFVIDIDNTADLDYQSIRPWLLYDHGFIIKSIVFS